MERGDFVFYDRFLELCRRKGVVPTRAAVEAGISKSLVSKWKANEAKEHTEWHTITLWRGLADVVDRYVRKGTQIYVEGRLRTREWMDKDNNKRYTTEILADTMNLLGRRSDNPASDGAPAPAYGAQQSGYQQGGGYQQSGGYQQGDYQQPAAAPQPQAAAPSSPSVPADDPDDLPF